MSNTEEIYDEEGNLITQEVTDAIDYKAELEKEKKEREKYETYFKSTAKELNEIKAKSKSQQSEDFDDDWVRNANEYLKSTWSKVLRDELWFASKEDLEDYFEKKFQEKKDLEKLDKFTEITPEKKKAILQLSKANWMSIEETIKEYKFIDDEWMENFRKPLVGNRKKTWSSIDINNPTQEDLEMIKKMSSDEFNKFMATK